MKKFIVIFLIMTYGAVFATTFFGPSVWVKKNSDGSGVAYAIISGDRYSISDSEYLNCGIYSNKYAVCTARDKNGNTVSARTYSAEYVNMLKTIEDSYSIQFKFNKDGEITEVFLRRSSNTIP